MKNAQIKRVQVLKKIGLVLSFVCSFLTYAQDGSADNPFTSLNSSLLVPAPGVYYFDIDGTTFDTYVDHNGYVLIATDFGNGTGNLPQGTSLTTGSRGILNETVLSTLTATTEVRLSSSLGSDVVSSNSHIIDRVVNNQTLHGGVADNSINDSWTGVNAGRFTGNATCTSPRGASLHQNIFHPCGNPFTFHWMPSGNFQRDPWNHGEISAGASLSLWVRDNSSALPIELVSFFAELNHTNEVELEWVTASEINNDYFLVQRSIDGVSWESIGRVEGAGNSAMELHYSFTDEQPYAAVSYYRIKQIDFDGQFSYSPVETVRSEKMASASIKAYPVPAQDVITIEGDESELQTFRIYNSMGQDVTPQIEVLLDNRTQKRLDISQLPTGIYFVKTKNTTTRINRI